MSGFAVQVMDVMLVFDYYSSYLSNLNFYGFERILRSLSCRCRTGDGYCYDDPLVLTSSAVAPFALKNAATRDSVNYGTCS
jgi:hypothetical protein